MRTRGNERNDGRYGKTRSSQYSNINEDLAFGLAKLHGQAGCGCGRRVLPDG